jgi:hypothetical protein
VYLLVVYLLAIVTSGATSGKLATGR